MSYICSLTLPINLCIMKKIYITFLVTILGVSSLTAQTNFDWDNNTTDNGTSIEQTENGITVIYTIETNDPVLGDFGGWGGTTGFALATGSNTNTTATFSFSTPTDITSIHAVQVSNLNPNAATWTFTPTGGSNSNVDKAIPAYDNGGNGGVTVDLNWTAVTEFTVTSSGPTVSFGFDDLLISSPLGNKEIETLDLELFPNPSTDFIALSGMNYKQDYEVINSLGTRILLGTTDNNEQISIKTLPKGVYFLKLKTGSAIKFIKN